MKLIGKEKHLFPLNFPRESNLSGFNPLKLLCCCRGILVPLLHFGEQHQRENWTFWMKWVPPTTLRPSKERRIFPPSALLSGTCSWCLFSQWGGESSLEKKKKKAFFSLQGDKNLMDLSLFKVIPETEIQLPSLHLFSPGCCHFLTHLLPIKVWPELTQRDTGDTGDSMATKLSGENHLPLIPWAIRQPRPHLGILGGTWVQMTTPDNNDH